MSEVAEDRRKYKVVVNHEDQYSLWPHDRESPAGWRDAGKVGTRQDCLAYIREVWIDLTPRSLRDGGGPARADRAT